MAVHAPADGRRIPDPPADGDAFSGGNDTGAGSGPGGATPAAPDPTVRAKSRRTLLLLIAVCVAPVIASYLTFYFMPPDGRTNYGDLINPQQDVSEVSVAVIAGLPAVDTQAKALTASLTASAPGDDGAAANLPPETMPSDSMLASTTPGGTASGNTTAGDTAPAGTAPAGTAPEGIAPLARWSGRWLMVTASPGSCDERCAEQLYKMRQVRLTQGKNRDRIARLWLVTDGSAPDARILEGYDVNGEDGMAIARITPALFAQMFPAAPGQQSGDHIFLIDPLGHLMMRFPADADPSRMKKDFNRLLKASRIG